MFYDLDLNTNSYSNGFKSHMKDFKCIIILLKSDKGFGTAKKNMGWIFYANGLGSI